MRRAIVYQLGLICALSGLCAGTTYAVYRAPHEASNLGPGEVSLRMALKWGHVTMWIDARSDNDFGAAHIPEAIQLNEDRWSDLLEPLLMSWTPDRRIVVYCDKAKCDSAEKVAERLREQVGLNDVYVLKGGWQAWLNREK